MKDEYKTEIPLIISISDWEKLEMDVLEMDVLEMEVAERKTLV
jgi:hypothetical protein